MGEPVQLGSREQQIADLLLQGCDNAEIATQLKMARRTVKAHFNRLFLRFGIHDGIKRVKLATLLYRRQLSSESSVEKVSQANGQRMGTLGEKNIGVGEQTANLALRLDGRRPQTSAGDSCGNPRCSPPENDRRSV